MDNYIGLSTQAILEHHGVKGMKWGVRKLYDGHKKNLLYYYKQRGMTDEEAQAKLQKRLRNEKIALGTAAAVAAGVAAYYGKNYVQDEFLGRSFKAGKKVDTVTSATKFDKDRHIYAAYRKHDKMKYRGIYGGQRARQRKNPFMVPGEVRKTQGLDKEDNIITLMANKKLKIAPNRAAKKTFKELYKNDSDFRKMADEVTVGLRSADSRFRKGSPYELFNVALAAQGKDADATKNINKFYGKLKEKGYAGLLDINDRKFSGFKSKNPTIFFDHKNLIKKGSKKLTDDIISDSENKLETIARRAMYAKQIGGNAAAGAAVGLISNEAAMTAARKLDEKKRKETRT